MHRIDHATAAPGNLFTEGNPATATPATSVTDDWLNDMQENLAQLVEAASIALVKGDGTQVTDAIQVLIAVAFGNLKAISTVSTTSSISAATVGNLVVLTGAGAITATLPAANSVPSGSCLYFVANNSAQTVTRAGSDTIGMNAGNNVNSIVLNLGDTLALVSNGNNSWSAFGGSRQLGYSDVFFSSIGTNGYQKLPSGLIVQWGTITTGAGGTFTWTFPIAFPNSRLSEAVGLMPGNNTVIATGGGAGSRSGTLTVASTGAAAGSGVSFQMIVIGN